MRQTTNLPILKRINFQERKKNVPSVITRKRIILQIKAGGLLDLNLANA